MRFILAVLALAGSFAIAHAQTFAPSVPVVVGVLQHAEPVGKIQASPGRPGDEILYRNKVWKHVVFVVVPNHPTGICLESAQAFAFFDPVITIIDVNGDGIDDAVGVSPSTGQTQVLTGLGLSACR